MTRYAAILVVASFLFSGCRLFGPDHDSPRVDIERARTVWADQTDGTYAFDLFHSCFCVYAGDFRVNVVDYEIVSIIGVPRGEAVPETHFDYMYSIEQMFDLVEDARRRDADVVEVEFSDRGFPVRINLDYSVNVADDELYMEVGNVTTDG